MMLENGFEIEIELHDRIHYMFLKERGDTLSTSPCELENKDH